MLRVKLILLRLNRKENKVERRLDSPGQLLYFGWVSAGSCTNLAPVDWSCSASFSSVGGVFNNFSINTLLACFSSTSLAVGREKIETTLTSNNSKTSKVLMLVTNVILTQTLGCSFKVLALITIQIPQLRLRWCALKFRLGRGNSWI